MASGLASFNARRNVRAPAITVSTIQGSSITTASITATAITMSTLTGSTISAPSISVSSLTGSTITSNMLSLSTLTVSSINSGTPGVAAYSTFNASSINTSSITVSSITTAPGYNSNIGNVLYTSLADSGQTAASFTTASLPATAPSGSVISGSYRLTAGASSGAAVMRLSSYTFVVGTTYNFTFTGTQGSQALALYVYQYNSAGTASTQISASVYSITTSATTVSGSFTPNASGTYTGTIVFYFQAAAVNQYVNFTAFSMNTGGLQVGIGTTNPGNLFSLYGSFGALMSITSSGTDANIFYSCTSTGGRNWYVGSGGVSSGGGTGNFYIYDATANVARLVVNSNGSVGIGKTAPASTLDITGTFAINNGIAATTFGQFQGIQMSYVGTGATGYANIVATNPGSTYNPIGLNIDGGNVGIGITNPSYKLTVKTGNLSYGMVHTDGTISVGTWIGTGGSLGTISNNDLHFFTNNGASRMRIDTSGNTTVVGNLTVDNGTTGQFNKYGNTAGYNMNINGGTTSNSPNVDFYAAGLRRMYVGYANTSDTFIMAENSVNLKLGTNSTTRLTIYTTGNSQHSADDYSYTTYGPNSTWGSYLVVGATPNRLGSLTAQVLSSNGNLHLDCCSTAARSTYINYYTIQSYASGATIESYGTFNHRNDMVVSGSITATQVYTNDWFRVNGGGGLYWQSYGYGIQPPGNESNSYGNIATYGTGRNGWSGFGAGSKTCYMTNGTEYGIHDNNYSWVFYSDGGSTRTCKVSGSVQCSQAGDRLRVFVNGVDTGGGYFYVNSGAGYGMASDERIKKNIQPIAEEPSMTFIKNLQPSIFCLKEESGKHKHCAADGTETGEVSYVCNCEQSGFIAQNVLASAVLAGIPKSVCNNWYDYEQELGLPDEERKAVLGVSTVPIVSHLTNAVKSLISQNTTQAAEIADLETQLEAALARLEALEAR